MTHTPARIDWFRVIVDLERVGMSLDAIAETIGRKKGWITNLKYTPGTDPKFHDGLMLLGVWKERTAWEDGQAIPMEDRRVSSRRGNSPESTLAGIETPCVSKPKDRPHGPHPERPDARSATERPGADAGSAFAFG